MGDHWQRLGVCLRRLHRHLDLDAVALTGGAAIEVHLARLNLPGRPRPLNDVDLVACSRAAISPGVTSDFLVSHFHVPHPGYSKFLVQLVDPDSRTRVDIFPGRSDVIERAEWHHVSGIRVRVLGTDAVLDHKMEVLAGATRERPVDGKHFDDAVLLARLSGREIGERPVAVLCREEYLTDPHARCARCECSVDAAFPLAPKERILDILGYC